MSGPHIERIAEVPTCAGIKGDPRQLDGVSEGPWVCGTRTHMEGHPSHSHAQLLGCLHRHTHMSTIACHALCANCRLEKRKEAAIERVSEVQDILVLHTS